MPGRRLAEIFLFGIGIAAGAANDWEAAGKEWWKHVEYLASDQLQGREPGTAGYEKAADYVAAHFERAGLKPAGTEQHPTSRVYGNVYQCIEVDAVARSQAPSVCSAYPDGGGSGLFFRFRSVD